MSWWLLVVTIADRGFQYVWPNSLGGTEDLQRWDWERLRSVVQGVIDRGGIGRPAALRLTVHIRGGEAEARRLQLEVEGMAAAWFDGKPESTYVAGGPGDGPDPIPGENPGMPTVTALKWPSGESAILSVSAGAKGPTGGNVMLMGSHGTVYHDIGPSDIDGPESRSE